jgi:hypothetical protein
VGPCAPCRPPRLVLDHVPGVRPRRGPLRPVSASKFEMLLALNAQEQLTLGRPHRQRPLTDALIVPRPELPLRIWLGTGGSPARSAAPSSSASRCSWTSWAAPPSTGPSMATPSHLMKGHCLRRHRRHRIIHRRRAALAGFPNSVKAPQVLMRPPGPIVARYAVHGHPRRHHNDATTEGVPTCLMKPPPSSPPTLPP